MAELLAPHLRFDKVARQYPERVALCHLLANAAPQTWTYRQLRTQISALAEQIKRTGIAPGERTLLLLPGKSVYLIAFFAFLWVGRHTGTHQRARRKPRTAPGGVWTMLKHMLALRINRANHRWQDYWIDLLPLAA